MVSLKVQEVKHVLAIIKKAIGYPQACVVGVKEEECFCFQAQNPKQGLFSGANDFV